MQHAFPSRPSNDARLTVSHVVARGVAACWLRAFLAVAALMTAVLSAIAAAAGMDGVSAKLPRGYTIIAKACSEQFDQGAGEICVVALGRRDEAAVYERTGTAPARPLLIFRMRAGKTELLGRNDTVVLALDGGGQCDPFNDGYDGIVVKGRFFTVQNGVACGDHWTDFITFRFDPATQNFVFHSEIHQAWAMSDGHDPDAEALVKQKPVVRREDPAHPLPFQAYRLSP